MSACRVSVSEITILLLYLLAAAAFVASRLPRYEARAGNVSAAAYVLLAAGMAMHVYTLCIAIVTPAGFNLSVGNAASLIGFELALVAAISAPNQNLRGLTAGLLLLGAIAAIAGSLGNSTDAIITAGWQVRAHVLISLISYGLLSVGAIVALLALMQERRLRAGQLSGISRLFAPLETTESLLFGVAAAGFAGLAIAILSGLTFVENLFAQHLVHKTALSLLALVVFGALLAGRYFAGWRGARAVKLYIWGFMLLGFAYFGSRIVLEQLLQRSWG